MKTYTYEKPYFQIEVLATGIFCALLAVWAVWATLQGSSFGGILVVAACVAGYQVWNTFVAIANPETVTIDGDVIAFSAFGRTDSFNVNEVSQFLVREFPTSGKMYVRVGDTNPLKGRYWLQTRQFSSGDELFSSIQHIELTKHPDSLKAKARAVNTEYIEHADAIDRVHAVQRARRRAQVEGLADSVKSKFNRDTKKKAS